MIKNDGDDNDDNVIVVIINSITRKFIFVITIQ